MRNHDRPLAADEAEAQYVGDNAIVLPGGDWVDYVRCSGCQVETPIVVIRYQGSQDAQCKGCRKHLVYRPWWEW